MATKKYKPTSPGMRSRQVLENEEVTSDVPRKSLLVKLKKKSGRNNQGKITVRRRGGGADRQYRIVDFKRRDAQSGKVVSIEYDPNRTSNIALISYKNGAYAYILAPKGIKIGAPIQSGETAEIKTGNSLPLFQIPVGSLIHNVELDKNRSGKIARAAGASVTLMAKGEQYATLKLPSGEIRQVRVECRATIGEVGNMESRNKVIGKAGVSRYKRRRPKVRGAVMNPADHPHGGGEGRAPVGMPGPRTPWGKPAHGYKTRKRKKQSSRLILRRRRNNKNRR